MNLKNKSQLIFHTKEDLQMLLKIWLFDLSLLNLFSRSQAHKNWQNATIIDKNLNNKEVFLNESLANKMCNRILILNTNYQILAELNILLHIWLQILIKKLKNNQLRVMLLVLSLQPFCLFIACKGGKNILFWRKSLNTLFLRLIYSRRFLTLFWQKKD